MQVELRNIYKYFGPVHANENISLAVPAGTIQGILGENGAGKSTLMKILSGYQQADQGEILLDGKRVKIQTPAQAIHHGVGMLHQDPLDFPPMKLVENFVIGQHGRMFPQWRRVRQEFVAIAGLYGFSLNPDAYVDSLTVGERQQLEILRLLWLGARVLILDEPTTGISAMQKERLFATLQQLAGEGKTVIFVSHKLEDVEWICHQAAVLRQGQLVGEAKPPFSTYELVSMMFGKPVSFGGRDEVPPGNPVLALDSLEIEDTRLEIRVGSFEVRAGEIIGLAGMEGSGQQQFLQACAGLRRPTGGHLRLCGRDITTKNHLAYKSLGTAYLPAARLEEGLIPGLNLSDHFTLAEPPPNKGLKGIFIDRGEAIQLAQERIRSYNIKGAPGSVIESLSGGNQQRALLALLRTPLALILLEHPTRGLDIESTMYIWSKLKDRCRQGSSIVFISSDLDEILRYSDRVLVFFAGKVTPPLAAESLSVEQLGQLIGGKGWDQLPQEAEDSFAGHARPSKTGEVHNA